MSPDAGRGLRLALAALWLADAALQCQPFMFTRAFGQMLAASAQGNPRVVAGPVTWSAGIIGQHPAVTNAAFATIQLLIALGIAWQPAVKVALAASVAWSVAVWWLGEGLGGVLTGSASPWTGAPGAVILYALLAVLLWPGGRDGPAPFAAGRPFGRVPARLLWLALWGGMAFLTLQTASMASPGQQGSAFLALVFDLVAVGIFLPAPCARIAVILAVIASAAIWVLGENFGAIFTGTATDPNSGLLLVLLAAAYWPARNTVSATVQSDRRVAGTASRAAGTASRAAKPTFLRISYCDGPCKSAEMMVMPIVVSFRRPGYGEGRAMSFFVEGDYFEVCNCDVSCNCVWLGAATQDNCDAMLAWHVTSGSKDGVDLSGLNAVMAVHSPKRMTDGGWKVALYLDERASAEQSEALGAVFSGGAGGYLAGLAPLIGEVAGVAPAAITFEKSDGSLHAQVANDLSMSSEQLAGMDSQEPAVITNAPFGAVTQPVRQARAKDVSYHGHWSADFSETNSFVTEFRYEG